MGRYKRKSTKRKIKNESTSRDLVVDFVMQNDMMRLVASRRFMDVISKIFLGGGSRLSKYLAKYSNYRSDFVYYVDNYSLQCDWNRYIKTIEDIKRTNWIKIQRQKNNNHQFYGNLLPVTISAGVENKKEEKEPDFKFEWDDFYDPKDKKGYYTPNNFSKRLKSGKSIYNMCRFIKSTKFNFIDISEDGNFINFIPMDKRMEDSWRLGEHEKFSDHKVVKMKVGRFINQFFHSLLDNGYFDNKHDRYLIMKKNEFGDEYGEYISYREYGLPQTEVEKFVNNYKLFYSITYGKEDFKFEVLKGEDIKKGYMRDNYLFGGTLSNSCMNNKTNFLDIYSKNENVSLLTLGCYGKIIGRALLWETKKGEKVMDRIYYGRDHDHQKFIMWGRERGYLIKEKDFYGRKRDYKHTIQLKRNIKYNKYPYLDSFRYFNRFTKRLQNHEPSMGGIFLPFKVIYNKIAYRDLVCTDGNSYRYGKCN
ncbi:MAG: hypothetical protein SLAVMIC_00265 [uncultured marine phage]|uniref:Uncharacterized protein n=1 Tax=uncultured marine phage TaxID=707152 RepID=A0A8D9CDU6_9VIRU|nr:MAG: hypothetical protein SLAVMIC_00265 [uncultured marine phage]